MKKFLALFLALLFTFVMGSCGGDEVIDNPNPSKPLENADSVIMSYAGETLSTGMYAFIFSYQKTNMLYSYQNLGSSDIVEDTEAFWNTETEKGKLGELTVKDINDHCRMLLLCNKMAAEYGVKLGDVELEYVTEELNDLTAAYGSKAGLEDYLRRYGITADDVEEYFCNKYLILALRDTLCSDGGVCEVSKAAVEEEIYKSYGKTTHIYLSDKKHNGDATSKAEEVLAALNNGAEFKDYTNLTEDTTYKTYPNGTLVSFAVDNAYSEAVSKVKGGEFTMCTLGEGAYVIKTFELKAEDIDALYDTAYTALADEKFMGLIEERYGLVEMDSNELNKYNIVTAEIIAF